jgi:hypothetical protein
MRDERALCLRVRIKDAERLGACRNGEPRAVVVDDRAVLYVRLELDGRRIGELQIRVIAFR